jgi:sulfoxide reductase heme-binding subunit YedZ
MVPLAITSTAGMIRRLGGKRWNALHKLVYVSAVAGAVHYYWLVKADVRRPLIYGAVVVVLLGVRIYWSRVKVVAPRRASATAVKTSVSHDTCRGTGFLARRIENRDPSFGLGFTVPRVVM